MIDEIQGVANNINPNNKNLSTDQKKEAVREGIDTIETVTERRGKVNYIWRRLGNGSMHGATLQRGEIMYRLPNETDAEFRSRKASFLHVNNERSKNRGAKIRSAKQERDKNNGDDVRKLLSRALSLGKQGS